MNMNGNRGSNIGSYPLAPCQEPLWLLHQVSDPGPAYTLPVAVTFEGELDAGALRDACQAVVDRHLPLRSAVDRDEQGAPVNVVRPVAVSIVEHEGRGRDAWRELLGDVCRRPFDLGRHPLVRFDLMRDGEGTATLLAVPHHFVFDGPSKAVFADEVSHCYRALRVGHDAELAPLAHSYARYASEERGRVEQLLAELSAALADVAPPQLGPQLLPFDRARPRDWDGDGGWVEFSIPRPLRERIALVGETCGVTAFQVLVSAFAALLYRYGNRDAVTVTVAMGTRTGPERDLIGLFANNLPVGVAVADDPPFAELLTRVRDQARRVSRHRSVPLARWVELLDPPRHPGLHPLFQVGLAYQAETFRPSALPGVTPHWEMLLPNHGAKCDLLLQILDRHTVMQGRLEYATSLFERGTAERVLGHYLSLLAEAVDHPELRLSALPVLGEAERHRVVVDWNRTEAAYPTDRCLHELVAEQAGRTPQRVAVELEGERVTYAELDGRAEVLARHLQRLGVGPDVLVGICVERSPDMVVGLLGVLKAGGAYVPLDPGYPAERLAVMLTDASPPVILTQDHLAGRLPAGAHLVRLDADWDDVAAAAGGGGPGPTERVRSHNLAYVMYTSGSTGRPKGVMIEHRSLVNFLWSMLREPGIGPDDVMLAVTSLSFDIAGLELFAPLLVGARVVLARGDVFLDGRQLRDALARSGATIMQATPVSWRLLLDSGWREGAGLRALCGGEALPWELAARLLETGVELWNLYGPTETTVWSSLTRVDGTMTADPGAPVPIGRPIANTDLYVLDARLAPVPAGVPGELHIGGDGVARGYRGDDGQTSARFLQHPFRPGARLYRTGDLTRARADGVIEFLGRVDHQVKLRGFRIEPGDVEAALVRHPAVRHAAVVLRDDGGEPVLVAYVVPDGAAPAAEELRAHVRQSVPPYMVPAAFVVLDRLPLTPNGKLDRKALPAPDVARPSLRKPFLAPRNSAEARLARIWAEVLGVDRVGADDDFFDLGGNSLRATQVAARVRDAFGVDVPVRVLFDAVTVADLARELQRAGAR